MKQLIINGKAIGSIWKTATPKTSSNTKHTGGHDVANFIPKGYSDPTASAAIGNIMRDERRKKSQIK